MTLTSNRYAPILIRQQRVWWTALTQSGIVLAIVLFSFSLVGLLDVQRLSEGIPDVLSVVGQMFPPDFSRAQQWIRPLLDTLAMSVAGTALAIALSLPLSLLAASNTTLHPALFQVTRLVLNTLRAIPELIMGIIFVAAVGFGVLPGVLAVGLHSVGMVGKFFAESIEHADKAPIEAVRAVGANPMQIIFHSVLPQVLPQMADVAFYRWEYNFRASTIMGAVGAGGIGFELIGALRLLRYEEVGAILIIILVMVTLVDSLSNVLRKRFA